MKRFTGVLLTLTVVAALGLAVGCGGDDDDEATATGASATDTTGGSTDVEFTGSLEEGVPVGYDEPGRPSADVAVLVADTERRPFKDRQHADRTLAVRARMRATSLARAR